MAQLKKLTMKVVALLDASEALQSLMTLDLPTPFSAHLSRTLNSLRADYKLYDEKRTAIQDDYVLKAEDGTWLRSDSGGFKLSDVAAYRAALTPILEEEIEIQVVTISLKRLQKDCKRVSGQRIEPLMWAGILIDDVDEPAPGGRKKGKQQAGQTGEG